MCGILGIFNCKGCPLKYRQLLLKLLKRIRHRGPDDTGVAQFTTKDGVHHFLGHERLSIVDVEHGHQPFFNENKTVCSATNGEIYNHLLVISKI